MRDPNENGWKSSAPNWIKRMGDQGDFSREFILDAPMLKRVALARPSNALDVGCGEGRFCRLLSNMGVAATGIDPIAAMVETAQARDKNGDYHIGFAEELPFEDASFDLVVSYLTLIDINDPAVAIAEMVRVLRPKGRLLVANLSSFATSYMISGKRICRDTGEEICPLGDYLSIQKMWKEWGGIHVQNWHRPLSFYMKCFLDQELSLRFFDEPAPSGGPEKLLKAYEKMPYQMMMEWQKAAT